VGLFWEYYNRNLLGIPRGEIYCNTPETIPQCIAFLEKSKTPIRSIVTNIISMTFWLWLDKESFLIDFMLKNFNSVYQ